MRDAANRVNGYYYYHHHYCRGMQNRWGTTRVLCVRIVWRREDAGNVFVHNEFDTSENGFLLLLLLFPRPSFTYVR